MATSRLLLVLAVSMCGTGIAQYAPAQATDWMLHPSSQASQLTATADGFSLSNGIIERSFLVRGGAFCTIEYKHLVSQQTFFRSPSPEGNLTLDSKPFDIGGCQGVPEEHHEFWNPLWQANLTANPAAFQYANHSTTAPAAPFEWEAGRRWAPKDVAWPPKGLHLIVNLEPPATATQLAGVLVSVHYELYDGIPVLRKWISVSSGAPSVTVNTMVMEMLRAPNFAPERLTVVTQQANNPTPFDQQVVPEHGQSFPGRTNQLWFLDPFYDQCCDQEIHVTYTYYTFLVLGYGFNVVFGGQTGPGFTVHPGIPFESLSVYEVLQDSSSTERQGLAVRRMGRVLTPQLLESPINFMITDVSSSAAMRLAVDQAADTGAEIVIAGFGAAGWCGMCFAQLNNASFVAWFKGEVEYARGRGVEVSGYTLMQHNGWGEQIPLLEQTLGRDGSTRGPTACFATDWHQGYRRAVLEFLNETGMGGIETDGQYESIPCSDTGGDHHHNGIEGAFHAGIKATLDFNVALKSLGVYQTGADAYAFSGANKWNHADTDAFGHLPLFEQQTVGRMYIYDSTISRLASSGTIGVNDLSASSKNCALATGQLSPLGRVGCIDFILGAQYGMGSIPNFRANRLYDPADPDAPAINATIAKWNAFYKQWRAPRPSGAAGVLLADLIHILRPDSRALEALVHCSSDGSSKERAIASFVNPSQVGINTTVVVPLYYTGLPPGTKLTVQRVVVTRDTVAFTGASSLHVLGAEAGFTDVVLPVELAASSYSMVLISTL